MITAARSAGAKDLTDLGSTAEVLREDLVGCIGVQSAEIDDARDAFGTGCRGERLRDAAFDVVEVATREHRVQQVVGDVHPR